MLKWQGRQLGPRDLRTDVSDYACDCKGPRNIGPGTAATAMVAFNLQWRHPALSAYCVLQESLAVFLELPAPGGWRSPCVCYTPGACPRGRPGFQTTGLGTSSCQAGIMGLPVSHLSWEAGLIQGTHVPFVTSPKGTVMMGTF